MRVFKRISPRGHLRACNAPLVQQLSQSQSRHHSSRQRRSDAYEISDLVLELDSNSNLAKAWNGDALAPSEKRVVDAALARSEPAMAKSSSNVQSVEESEPHWSLFKDVNQSHLMSLATMSTALRPHEQNGPREMVALSQLFKENSISSELAYPSLVRKLLLRKSHSPLRPYNQVSLKPRVKAKHYDAICAEIEQCRDLDTLSYLVSVVAQTAAGQQMIVNGLGKSIFVSLYNCRNDPADKKHAAHSKSILTFLCNLETNLARFNNQLPPELIEWGLFCASAPYNLPALRHFLEIAISAGLNHLTIGQRCVARLRNLHKDPVFTGELTSNVRAGLLTLITGWHSNGVPQKNEQPGPSFRELFKLTAVHQAKRDQARLLYRHYLDLFSYFGTLEAFAWEWRRYASWIQEGKLWRSASTMDTFKKVLAKFQDDSNRELLRQLQDEILQLEKGNHPENAKAWREQHKKEAGR